MSSNAQNQPANDQLLRNPELLDPTRSRLLVVDVQEKLIPVIQSGEQVTSSIKFLLEVAAEVVVPISVSEQYPQGLGPTVAAISRHAPFDTSFEKLRFSAADEFCRSISAAPGDARDTLDSRDQIVVVGIETHVCVMQTAMDLIGRGFRVNVVADAVGSRNPIDHETALTRLRDNAVTVCTAESVAFEWCEVAGTDRFRAISRLVRARDASRSAENADS